MEKYTSGVYEGLPIVEKSSTWLVDLFLAKAKRLDRKARTQKEYVESFADQLENGDTTEAWYEEFLSQLKDRKAERPAIVVADHEKERLNVALDRFLKNTFVRNPQYAINTDADYSMYWLIKNLTNSDTEHIVDYVNRYADFVEDKTFEKMRMPVKLGRMGNCGFYAQNTEEYEAGLETPDLFLFWAENGTQTALLPFLRYGIEKTENGSTAYVYAIQKRSVVEDEFNEELKRIFAKANSGVKEYRNIQPSMLCVLSSFAGMLNAKGITDLKVPDFIVRRWGEFWGAETESDNISIQTNATNKFLYTFLRLDNQFKGIDTTAYPGDCDSFLHMTIAEDAHSDNEMLQTFFEMGKNAVIEREQNPVEPDTIQLLSEWENPEQ